MLSDRGENIIYFLIFFSETSVCVFSQRMSVIMSPSLTVSMSLVVRATTYTMLMFGEIFDWFLWGNRYFISSTCEFNIMWSSYCLLAQHVLTGYRMNVKARCDSLLRNSPQALSLLPSSFWKFKMADIFPSRGLDSLLPVDIDAILPIQEPQASISMTSVTVLKPHLARSSRSLQ